MSITSGFSGGGYGGQKGDKGTSIPLTETFRLAMADPDLRQRILFVLFMFAVFAFGVHLPIPIPGIKSSDLEAAMQGSLFSMLNAFGGGALRRLSIFALGLNPYITASIIMQILNTAFPSMKKELQEGGEYARRKQNKHTRALTLGLCLLQGWGLFKMIGSVVPTMAALPPYMMVLTIAFWTAGAMFMLWLGEQISEKGIGNGVSLMIFAGIILSLPQQGEALIKGIHAGAVQLWSVIVIVLLFLVSTWLIVYFTTAQRRIPIQHMRRQIGSKLAGGQTSYLPLSLLMAGVMPIIFAVSLIYLPSQFAMMFGGPKSQIGGWLTAASDWLNPNANLWYEAIVGMLVYTALIFFFTYFWTAIQYNVEDMSQNLKRGGSFVPGVRPGKQTKDFFDNVISRITIVGATFIAFVALLQYIGPRLAQIDRSYVSMIGATSLLILVQVALETMRQIEANLLMKQYGN